MYPRVPPLSFIDPRCLIVFPLGFERKTLSKPGYPWDPDRRANHCTKHPEVRHLRALACIIGNRLGYTRWQIDDHSAIFNSFPVHSHRLFTIAPPAEECVNSRQSSVGFVMRRNVLDRNPMTRSFDCAKHHLTSSRILVGKGCTQV